MIRAWCVASAVALAAPAHGAATATPPRVMERAAAEYPAWAIGSGVATEVELAVRIGSDGRLLEVRVVPYDVRHDILTAAMRASFDSAAVRAVRRWSFRPATHGGVPVAARMKVWVPFADPADPTGAAEVDSTSSARDPLEDLARIDRLPAPTERETPEWPAAARYVCRGRVIVQAGIDERGVVCAVRIAQRLDACPDALLAAAIDSAVVRAAWRWRYEPPELRERSTRVVVPIAFRIPDPPTAARAVVGCVRDSFSGRALPGAEVLGRESRPGEAPPLYGRTDDTGWFVLQGRVAEAPRIRGHVFCRGGGFRRPRIWARPGDEITLYVWQKTCTDDPGR